MPADWRPRYNAAPSQPVAVVGPNRRDGAGRGLAMLRWGFVPRWADDPDGGPKPINAKAETVATSPPFRDSFRDRRCLIPADGFYEWGGRGGQKRPYHFRLRGGGPFAFAGVWDVWGGGAGKPVRTCCRPDRAGERGGAAVPRPDAGRPAARPVTPRGSTRPTPVGRLARAARATTRPT